MPSLWDSLLPASLRPTVDTAQTTALIPLPALGGIRLTGPESMKFLQGQTTTDFRDIEKGKVLPGAICSLKGRVLFSFIAVPVGENVLLVLPADQIEAALAHLKKFAVFSKTRLESTSADTTLLGLAGPDTDRLLEQLGMQPPAAAAMSKSEEGTLSVRLFNENRCLVVLPNAVLDHHWASLQEKAEVVAEDVWWAADIHAGFTTVFTAGRDRFQPQELNYQALAAVSYNKGCYTGQEVVARLYFRGKLKQRVYRLEAATTAIGEDREIFSNGSRAGEVLMAAREPGERVALLAVVKNAAVGEGKLTLGENGPALQVLGLPYELPAVKEE